MRPPALGGPLQEIQAPELRGCTARARLGRAPAVPRPPDEVKVAIARRGGAGSGRPWTPVPLRPPQQCPTLPCRAAARHIRSLDHSTERPADSTVHLSMPRLPAQAAFFWTSRTIHGYPRACAHSRTQRRSFLAAIRGQAFAPMAPHRIDQPLEGRDVAGRSGAADASAHADASRGTQGNPPQPTISAHRPYPPGGRADGPSVECVARPFRYPACPSLRRLPRVPKCCSRNRARYPRPIAARPRALLAQGHPTPPRSSAR